MDLTGFVIFTIVLTYLGVLIYLANQIEAARTHQPEPQNPLRPEQLPSVMQDRQPMILRWLLYGVLAMTFSVGLVVFQTSMMTGMAENLGEQLPADVPIPEINMVSALVIFGLAIAASVISFQIINSIAFRQRIQRLIGPRWTFDADSVVHLTAAVLMLSMIVWILASFVLQGGIDGTAENIAAQGINIGDILFQGVLLIVVAMLGVGMGIRRSLSDTAQRLGLRVPVAEDITWGVGFGVLFLGMLIIMGLIWAAITPPEVFEEQTAASQQLALAFSVLPLALLLSATAAISEEILIRGAMQPVFGILGSSLFFVVLHTQYTLTPATLIIFIVSLGLGWLRQRQSTNAAIIAHFVFNILQFV